MAAGAGEVAAAAAESRATEGAAGVEGCMAALAGAIARAAADAMLGLPEADAPGVELKGRGRGGPTHPRPEGMSPTSLRHCWPGGDQI